MESHNMPSLCLASFTQHVFKVPPCCSGCRFLVYCWLTCRRVHMSPLAACPSADGHLGCFLFLAFMSTAAVNIPVTLSLSMYVFSSLGYVLGWVAGSHSVFVFCLTFWRTVFQSGCSTDPRQQRLRVPISARPRQHLFFTVVLWCRTVVWVCISLVTNEVQQHFTCLLAVSMSSSETCLFKPFARF